MSDTTANPQDFVTKRKQPLLGTFSISVLIHAAMIALLGGVVVFKVLERPPAQFKPPPPPAKVTKLEPRKLQHKIKIREQQQNSGRPRVSPRLTANRVSGISLPEIEVDPMAEPVKTNIRKSLGKNFSKDGLGTGFGSGTGSGGLGLGTSTVSFFGINAKGERIAFIIDLSRSMVEDEKGGLNGIVVLKNELKKMVEKLNDGTFFNLIFFDDSVDIFKPKLVVAKSDTKKEADAFISPYYSEYGKELLAELFRRQAELALGNAPAQLHDADDGIPREIRLRWWPHEQPNRCSSRRRLSNAGRHHLHHQRRSPDF